MTSKQKRAERYRNRCRREFYRKFLPPKQVEELLAMKNAHNRHKRFLVLTQKICQFCGSKDELTIDHIIPVSITKQQRQKNLANQQLLCRKCNQTKADKII